MARKRPTAVLVIAIFHFIFAACGGITNLLQVSGAAGGLSKLSAGGDPRQAKLQEDIQRAIETEFPAYKTYERVEGGLGLLLAILLLVAGLGLLNMRPWARGLSILYAVLAILNILAGLAIIWTYVMPAMRSAMRAAPGIPPEAAKVGETVAGAVMVGGSLLGLIYPIAVLIVMLLPGVAAAFRAPDVSVERPEREEWDEDQYDRGERWREQPPDR